MHYAYRRMEIVTWLQIENREQRNVWHVDLLRCRRSNLSCLDAHGQFPAAHRYNGHIQPRRRLRSVQKKSLDYMVRHNLVLLRHDVLSVHDRRRNGTRLLPWNIHDSLPSPYMDLHCIRNKQEKRSRKLEADLR